MAHVLAALMPTFLSTPSERRATGAGAAAATGAIFLSTPSARRTTSADTSEGGSRDISIHALREEDDLLLDADADTFYIFLSTPSARRATAGNIHFAVRDAFLSTPSARRATMHRHLYGFCRYISIHALREEDDLV